MNLSQNIKSNVWKDLFSPIQKIVISPQWIFRISYKEKQVSEAEMYQLDWFMLENAFNHADRLILYIYCLWYFQSGWTVWCNDWYNFASAFVHSHAILAPCGLVSFSRFLAGVIYRSWLPIGPAANICVFCYYMEMSALCSLTYFDSDYDHLKHVCSFTTFGVRLSSVIAQYYSISFDDIRLVLVLQFFKHI